MAKLSNSAFKYITPAKPVSPAMAKKDSASSYLKKK